MYLSLSFVHPCQNLEDAGYDSLYVNAKRRLNKRAKLAVVAESRRRRAIGDIPPTYPNGWFAILDSDEVGEGQMKRVSALGPRLINSRLLLLIN